MTIGSALCRAAAAAIAIAITAGSAEAAAAIAIGACDRHGYASDYATADQARTRALIECASEGDRSCRVVSEIPSGCVALAVSGNCGPRVMPRRLSSAIAAAGRAASCSVTRTTLLSPLSPRAGAITATSAVTTAAAANALSAIAAPSLDNSRPRLPRIARRTRGILRSGFVIVETLGRRDDASRAGEDCAIFRLPATYWAGESI